MSKGLVDKALSNPVQLAIGLGIVAGVLYFLARTVLKQAAAVANGVVSGNNELTAGTAFQGAGIAGTLGAAADEASGGALSNLGEALGSWIYDAFHTEYDPNSGLQTGAKTVADGARATDKVWGPVGQVTLRAVR